MIRSMIKTAASPSACHSPFSIMSSCLEWCRADFLLLTWLRQCFALFLCFSDARVTRVIVYMTINVEMIGTSVRDAKEVNSTCDLAGAFRLRYGSCVPRVCWVLITIRGGSALPLTLYSGLWSEGIHRRGPFPKCWMWLKWTKNRICQQVSVSYPPAGRADRVMARTFISLVLRSMKWGDTCMFWEGVVRSPTCQLLLWR